MTVLKKCFHRHSNGWCRGVYRHERDNVRKCSECNCEEFEPAAPIGFFDEILGTFNPLGILNCSEPSEPIIVFAGGCFDILHASHIKLLQRARQLGTRLVVGLNTDLSISFLKGNHRPIIPFEQREICLKALRCVDEVIPIDEIDPCNVIEQLKPDIVVKGNDYSLDKMPEAPIVEAYGGKIVFLPRAFEEVTTSSIIERIGPRNSVGV